MRPLPPFGLAGAWYPGYRFVLAWGLRHCRAIARQLTHVAIDSANAAFPWTVGSLNARSQMATAVLAVGLAVGYGLAIILGPSLDTLQFSDPVAINLGTRLKRVRGLSLCAAVLLTGLAVAVAGPVGMVALLAPEVARTFSPASKVPLTASALAGAIFMVIADLTGRLVLAPLEIPVGLITAIVGSPYLIWILVKPSPERVMTDAIPIPQPGQSRPRRHTGDQPAGPDLPPDRSPLSAPMAASTLLTVARVHAPSEVWSCWMARTFMQPNRGSAKAGVAAPSQRGRKD